LVCYVGERFLYSMQVRSCWYGVFWKQCILDVWGSVKRVVIRFLHRYFSYVRNSMWNYHLCFFGFTKTVSVCSCVSGTRMVANVRTSHGAVFFEIGTATIQDTGALYQAGVRYIFFSTALRPLWGPHSSVSG
jgi:hypothetical protein